MANPTEKDPIDNAAEPNEGGINTDMDPQKAPGATELMQPDQIVTSQHEDTLEPDGGTDGDDTEPGTGLSIG